MEWIQKMIHKGFKSLANQKIKLKNPMAIVI
jgi:hypothetical protein